MAMLARPMRARKLAENMISEWMRKAVCELKIVAMSQVLAEAHSKPYIDITQTDNGLRAQHHNDLWDHRATTDIVLGMASIRVNDIFAVRPSVGITAQCRYTSCFRGL